MPYPGRRSKKTAKVALVSVLIFLTAMGGVLPVLPGIVNTFFGTPTGPGASLTKSKTSAPTISLPGTPLSPGTIQNGVRNGPSFSKVLDGAIAPKLSTTTDAFEYQTSYGVYSFNRSSPFIFSLKSVSGALMAKTSFFFVRSSVPLMPGGPVVVMATDNQFKVQYNALFGTLVVGQLQLQVDFQSSVRPKFTISFVENPAWTFGSFNIIWLTVPLNHWLKTGGSSAVDIDSVLGVQGLSNTSSSELGPSSDASLWTDWLTTDWSDAPGGKLESGTISLAGQSGIGQTIVFPSNQATIDPTQVATSNVNFATSYSTQRKVLSYAGKYYVFFYSGSNILWRSSLDQVTWSTTFVAGGGTAYGGPIGYNFDIYQSGSSLGLVWLYYNSTAGGDGTTALYFKHGTIVAGDIYWYSTVRVASWSQPYSWPPSVAIGSDGTFWVAGIWYDASLNYNIWIYKSTDGSTFSLSTNYLTSSSNSRNDALQLVPLPQGKLMSLTSHYYDQTIRWTIWNPLSPSGGSWSSIQSYNVSLPANTPKNNLMSTTTTPDGFVHMIFQQVTGPSTWNLAWAYFNATSGQWTVSNSAVQSGGSAPLYPSISSDSLGNLYAFWANQVGSSTFGPYFVSRSKGDFNWNPNTLQPFGSISNPTWLSASRTSSKEVLLAWTQGSAAPYSIYLGSIPLPSGIASGPPTKPWSYQGLSPYEQYFTQNGEYVSPGNGLLTVSQTDISDAGRNGLSLSISRVYSQPFTLDQGSPLNYETSPYANLGNGWQLNFPWIATQYLQGPKYLHFLNGELFPIVWNNLTTTISGDVFGTFTMINHQTEDFVLNETMDLTTNQIQNYKLVTKDGTSYNFNGNGVLTTLIDRTGQNQLSFSYNPSLYLSTITDTVGRIATLKYDASNHLANVTYAGQLVKYGYSGSNLVTATDAVGRVMTVRYSPQSSWLISGVVYTAGGNSTYTYGSINVGTDAVNYYLTLQTLYNPGQVVKSSSFSYNITDGEITNTSVKQSDGQAIQGYTNYLFNAQSSSMTRTVLNATLTQMLKDQFWYDPTTGRSVQDDTYSGTSLARSFYNSRFYDVWGNVIYTRDNSGHESYSSFANTNSQYIFQSPGSLSTTSNGKIFFDDFNGPSLNTTAWVQGASGVNTATTVANSLLKLTAASSTSGTWQSDWVRTTGTNGYPFYTEVNMENWYGAGDTQIGAEFILSPQATASNGNPFQNNDALRLVLNDGPYYRLETNVGGVTTTLWTGTAGGMHSLVWKLELTNRNTLRVYLREWTNSNYQLVYSTTSLGLSTSFTPAYAYLSFGNTRTSTYFATFDYVGLYSSNSITVNGLQTGQTVSLYDWNNAQQATGTVASGQTSLTLNATQMIFPYGYLQISEVDGRTVQFTSPTREFWGGSAYSYTPPFRSGGMTRITTGFLQYQVNHFVDESLPSGAVSYSDGGDAWIWASSSLVPSIGDEGPSGELVHAGLVASGTHEHYFNASSSTLYAASGSFLNQYVYIPSTSVPSEIMLQFHTIGGNWEHRAYWGSNSITACGTTGPTCGTNGTASRFFMGPLPSTQNSWIQLIVKTDDVGVNGLNINGWAYTLYNGGVFWDESELGAASGTITFNNLLAGQKIELYNSQGVLKVSGTVATGQTSVSLNTYSTGINAFAFKGFVKVYSTGGSVQYSSSLMTDIWGGDTYSYNQPVFSNSFNGGAVGAVIHNAIIGTAQYQNATSTPEELYPQYDAVGDVVQSSQMHNGSPLSSTYTYDAYGNKLSEINPATQTIYYAYSPAYQRAYLTNVTRVLTLTVNSTTSYSYNFVSGTISAVIDPMGNRTDLQYDSINRVIVWKEQAVNGTRTEVDTTYQDSQNNFYSKNEKGNYTLYAYDGLGRSNSTKGYSGGLSSSVLVSANATYNWQNTARTFVAPNGNVTTYSYDYRGRLVKTTNPDTSYKLASFDDLNLVTSNYDENGHRTDYVYDALHRLIAVREYSSVSSYFVTFYTYDGVGNLAKVVDAKGQTTIYAYDDLNRLILTKYPDGFNETKTYDNVGNVLTKKDPNGNTITYAYDSLNRLTTTTYPGNSIVTYSYDKNGNQIGLFFNGNSATFSYDARNRLSKETWTVSGTQYTMTYGYDSAGNLVSTIYPDGTSISNSIDPLNNINTVKSGNTTLATLTYSAGNRISGISYGNGVRTTYSYDSRNRPIRMKTVQGSTALLDLNYTYDAVGNVAGINTETYSYDALNRLTYSSGPWGVLQYGYDSVGNRIWAKQGSTNTTYTYGSYNRLISVGSVSYTYDNNGNLRTTSTGGTTTTYNYEFENRLANITQAGSTLGKYIYSPLGARIQKTEGSITTVYLNQRTNVLYEKQTAGGSTTNDYVYDMGLLIAKVSGGVIFYFHADTLGSIRLVTSGARTSFSSNYQPFGSQYGSSGTDPTYKYAGKPLDGATGLYYYGARYYDPITGRFITRDPASQPLSDAQGRCGYAYARNNPETLTDPTGACLHAIDLAGDILGFILTLLGTRINDFWNFQYQLYVNYILPAIGLINSGNFGGFIWGILPNLVLNLITKLVFKMSWWQVGFMLAQIGSGTWQIRLAYGVISLLWSLMWQFLAPPSPPYICSDWWAMPWDRPASPAPATTPSGGGYVSPRGRWN
jgi:RHS repeat-associated protein